MIKIKLKWFTITTQTLILISSLLLITAPSWAESNFRTFQTQQHAQGLIDTIAPLYGNQARFSAKNNTLIVKAPVAILNEIEQLLKELDRPSRNLLIEVASSLDGGGNYQQDSIEGRIKIGNNTVIKNRAPAHEQPNASIRYTKDGSVIKTTHTRRSNTRNNPNNFKVRTTEGRWAFIQTGQQVPYYNRSPYPYGSGYGYGQNSVQFADVTSGFEVFPLLNGEQVTLKVRPKNRSMNREYPGRIDTRSMETIVSGRLCEWIYLGGASNQINEQSSGTLHSTKRYSNQDANYRIRVNLIN
ncbi:hypothetical protein [sulfur-oxidizing endosymbiont of Gigantopelta aegis]|uniref:hypothetical protein n=1 Tax=sulfur-oxidizing endosymbiont of Gigantopelta aegis TaxID=2794934 RepID=UPI0018DE5871|nr:hypothetical protein [sulfur-oxidizing endosymbiont of Gigantopelta aegis]